MVTDTTPEEKTERRRAVMEPWRERCRIAGVTQDQIAAEYDCTRPFVVNVFAGRRVPPAALLAAIERLCKVRERRMKRRAG